MTSTNVTVATTSGVDRGAQFTAWASQVPARVNTSSIAFMKKATDSCGFISAAAGTGVFAVGAAALGGGWAYSLTEKLVTAGANPDAIQGALVLGAIAGAAPAITGWFSALVKDGAARGFVQGLGITASYFAGHAITSLLGTSTDSGVWLAGVLGSLSLVAYASSVIKRRFC